MGEALVICDSSVLIVYARSGQLRLLQDLFQALEIPAAVEEECVLRGGSRPGAPALRQAIDDGWIRVSRTPRASAGLTKRFPNLGRGEAAAIALARARSADAVLMDDSLARHVAKIEGLRVVGSLGVLALAHERGVLKSRESVEQALRQLLHGGLWTGADLVQDFWDAFGGRP